MADTHSALEQLADIAEPETLQHFALAPLWWLLLALVLAGAVYLLLSLYQRWRYFAAKRQALQLLEQLALQNDAPVQINLLLKRVLQHYQPGHPALSCSTTQWQHWLAQQHPLPLPDLTQLLYQGRQDVEANEQLYQFARAWLTAYRGKAVLTLDKPEVASA
ncbi:DUF4381 family protein [Rheinheimera pleomorphica]|uniref:DUF4381 family protein n=1 Tax=Rheinheimera pleomorphica TaxID=2703963 RepID=UPI0014225FE4|nr:DUF4381 family protein [Rheinheimera pleomorphica]